MANTLSTPQPASAASPRWQQAVSLTAMVSILFFWAPIVVGALRVKEPALLLVPLASFPLWLPYAYIVWQVRGKTPKKGLAVAVSLGGVVSLFTVLFVLLWVKATKEFGWWPGGYLVLFAVVQATLLATGMKAYNTAPPEVDDKRTRRRAVIFGEVYALLLAVLVAIFSPEGAPRGMAANDASAAGSLRTINTAAGTYQDTYNNGFPPILAVLAPPPAGIAPNCNAADLIDSVLASGQKHGYAFVYRPGPPVEKAGASCTIPGIKSYTVTARPLKFDRTGRRSFFTDESGVIRWTPDDRPATAQDPPI